LHGTKAILLHVGLVFQSGGIHLHHLADFLDDRHAREQRLGLHLAGGELQRGVGGVGN